MLRIRVGCYLLAVGLGSAAAQVTVPEREAPGSATSSSETGPEPGARGAPGEGREPGRLNFKVDPDTYSIISTVRGLSTHKASYIFPLTWTEDYHGDSTEMVFQFSAKQSLFGTNLFVGYTQRSFWQYLNQEQSSPFRETNYNPEMFYRWIPTARIFNHWGADFGLEHESNGRSIGESRSWNRAYFAPFQAKGRHLAYLKFWHRIPEGRPSSPENPNGDDNPDITDFLGNGELSYSQQIGGDQLLTGWLRGSTRTGKGAFAFTWSIPSPGGYAFYGITVFHGYGESLIDYNEKTTRVMAGLLLAR